MKKILLGIVLGMVLHKGLNYAYDYSFEESFRSPTCQAMGSNLDARFACTYKEMGLIEKLKYVLVRPNADRTFNKSFWMF